MDLGNNRSKASMKRKNMFTSLGHHPESMLCLVKTTFPDSQLDVNHSILGANNLPTGFLSIGRLVVQWGVWYMAVHWNAGCR